MASAKSENPIYVITGASRGIGLELARQALSQGIHVVATARKAALELKSLEEKSAGQLRIVELDVDSDTSAAQLVSRLNVDRVDVLINNAGTYIDRDGKCESVLADVVLKTLSTNSVGPLRVTQALLPLLKKSSQPRVANITSLMGSIGDNSSGGSLAYRMSKAALNMLTKNLALEERKLIVLSLHPGWVKTAMGGEQAPLQPTASAEALLKIIRESTLESSGKFFNYNGQALAW